MIEFAWDKLFSNSKLYIKLISFPHHEISRLMNVSNFKKFNHFIINNIWIVKEINDDAVNIERKWGDDGQPFYETRRTPDLENMDMEQYQQSIAQ